jgi:hypothetical protein
MKRKSFVASFAAASTCLVRLVMAHINAPHRRRLVPAFLGSDVGLLQDLTQSRLPLRT